jgi:hypothetical protein
MGTSVRPYFWGLAKVRRCELKSELKAPTFKSQGLKLKYDTLLSSFAFDFNLRPYSKERAKEIVDAAIVSYSGGGGGGGDEDGEDGE